MRALRSRQSGITLLLLVAILALGSTWYMVRRLEEMSANTTASDRARNAAVLNRAKQALIGYVGAQAAKKFEDNPGALPCPEAAGYFDNPNNDGQSASSCSLPKVGRFPWRTIGTDKLVDSAGEPLWYAVSPGWAVPSAGTKTVINSNTAGQLTVDGAANDAVALIIAPGPAFNVAAATGCTARTQTRLTTGNPDWRDYLECENATNPADSIFVTTGASGSFNDQVIKITAADILPAIEAGVAHRFERDVAPAIRGAYTGGSWPSTPVLPFAVSFADPTTSAFQGAAVISSGTVAVTNNDLSATLSAPMTPSLAGRYLQVPSGSATAYLISAHTSGTDALTLNTAYLGATNAASSYSIMLPQGLLPVTYSETSPGSGTACTTGNRCNPLFVAWTSGTLTGANLYSTNCSVVTTTVTTLHCTYYYLWPLLGGPARDESFTLNASASNVGMALRQFNTAVSMINVNATPTASGTINIDGSAAVTLSGSTHVSDTGTFLSNLLCSLALGDLVWGCQQGSLDVPIGLLADHPVLDATDTANGYGWFLRNKWHEVAYYAVAPNVTPAGTRSCVTSSTCLQLTYHRDNSGANDEGKPRALLIIGGRQLSGQNRPATVLTDLLEGANAGGVSPFELRSSTLLTNRTFNDRFAVIDNN